LSEDIGLSKLDAGTRDSCADGPEGREGIKGLIQTACAQYEWTEPWSTRDGELD
jgi:hypothetical protein